MAPVTPPRPGGIGPVDLTRRVPLRIVADTDLPDAAPGDAQVLGRYGAPDGPPAGFVFRCPGCGCESMLALHPVAPGDTPGTPRWTVTAGDPRRAAGLTLSPSIHHAAPRGCGWHGYLRDGVLVPC